MQQSVKDVSLVSGNQQINDGAVLRILQQRRRLTLARQRVNSIGIFRFVPKADILRCGKERRYSITSSARENTWKFPYPIGSHRGCRTTKMPKLATTP